jgi:hypothetical protein
VRTSPSPTLVRIEQQRLVDLDQVELVNDQVRSK